MAASHDARGGMTIDRLSRSRPHYDPNRLLDMLMQRRALRSDKALAKLLGFAPRVLAGLRSGRIALAPWMLGWIAEAGGMGVEEARRLIGDRRARARPNFMPSVARRDAEDGA